MISVRTITEIGDLREAVRLQKTIWGFEDLELLPVRMFVVAHRVGGQTMAAFDDDTMVGFLIAVPGVKTDGTHYLHSNMMGVLADYRNLGVGRQLKLAQREEALERGIEMIEWTFDPLELKNAFFNVQRLGAVVERYVLNQYGITSSLLHGGLPTDRCVASWSLRSERVERVVAGDPAPAVEIVERIEVPNEIGGGRRERQASISERFLEYLRRDLYVAQVERGETNGVYLFAKRT
ncbi:MAG: GNAT family N-acetyltransferase [Bryobacterales bacterium]|nr:GNAT family N-acetyltransferase [Bryobacterales bacterium]